MKAGGARPLEERMENRIFRIFDFALSPEERQTMRRSERLATRKKTLLFTRGSAAVRRATP